MVLSRVEITMRYRQNNPEWLRTYRKEYYRKNTDSMREYREKFKIKKERIAREFLLSFFLVKYLFRGKGKVPDPTKLSHSELNEVIGEFIKQGGVIQQLTPNPNYNGISVRS